MKNSKYIIVLIIFCAIIFGIFGYFCGRTPVEVVKTDTVTKTDTFWKVDSCKIIKYVPKKIVEIKRDTLYKKDSTEIILVSEAKEYKDTVSTNDGDSIILNNYVSGINPQLDSTKVNLKKKEIIKTVEITKYLQNKKTFKDRFHLGLQVGYGLGLQSRKFDSYVGFGVSFDL